MRRFTGFRRLPTLAVGLVAGFILGSASVSTATLGQKGWNRFGQLFKEGYVAGFVECVRVAKGLDPFSYVSTQFPAPSRAKPTVWVKTIDDLFAQEEHKNRTLPQLMIIAGTKLEPEYGDQKFQPGDQRLEALREAIDRQRKALLDARKTVEAAEGAKKAAETPSSEPKAEEAAPAPDPGANGHDEQETEE